MMIRTEHLSKSYGEKEAVCDLTLEIRRGEIFGLLGPNGAGKSTLMKIIMGIYQPDQGELYIDGERISSFKPVVSLQKEFTWFLRSPCCFLI